MTPMGNSWIQRYTLFASGMVSKGVGVGGLDEGVGAIMVAALMGAFGGLLVGLILTQIAQYISFLMGRQMNGYSLTIASTLLGAVLCAWWTAMADPENGTIPAAQGLVEN